MRPAAGQEGQRCSCPKKTAETIRLRQLLLATLAWFQSPQPAPQGQWRIYLCFLLIPRGSFFLLYSQINTTQAHDGLIAILTSKWLWIPKFLFITHLAAIPYLIQTYFKAENFPEVLSSWAYFVGTFMCLVAEVSMCLLRKCWSKLSWEWLLTHGIYVCPLSKSGPFKLWHNSIPKILHKRNWTRVTADLASNSSPLSIYPLIWIILKRCKSN